MMGNKFRIEHDSLGKIQVPHDALYGAQTQRAVENFPISGLRMPRAFIRALGMIKGAAANVNQTLGLLDETIAQAIQQAAAEVEQGKHDAQFPIDVFQTGSGTSTNMNANEVIARLAQQRSGKTVHANDHVNMCQSSNDVIPSAIHVSACLKIHHELQPALRHLDDTISARAAEFHDVIKTGRTHLMDAMPLRLQQELGGWAAQVRLGSEGVETSLAYLRDLAIGGTAVGTGVNAHREFGARVAARLAQLSGIAFRCNSDYFQALSSQDAAVQMSGQLRALAVGLMKIANDLRLMNSGPLAGLAEIQLPALQPGSSIMPGKVNPVIPEAVTMVCAQVEGNDVTVTIAGQSGNFQLNVMLPVIAYNLLQSIELLTNAARVLADKAIAGFSVNRERLCTALEHNPILATALNRVIGYDRAAAIAKTAYAQQRPILEVAKEMTGLDEAELKRLLDPAELTKGG
jgi:fumarate hydratase class II